MNGKTKYPGVRIRGKSIQIDFRYKNVRCRETLKLKPTATNLKIASSILGNVHMDIVLNKLNYAEYFPNSKNVERFGGIVISNLTVSDALDWWFDEYKPENERTAKLYSNDIKNYIKPGLGQIYLRDLKAKQIKDWINTITLSASSKNGILSALRQMFQEAMSENLVDENIMLRIKGFKRPKPVKNPLTISEIDTILNHFTRTDVHSYYKFALWTGLDTGEQLGLKWDDINLDNYTISIFRRRVNNKDISTKETPRDRVNDLLYPAYQALVEIMPNDYLENPMKYKNQYIFQSENTNAAWQLSNISEIWAKALKELNKE